MVDVFHFGVSRLYEITQNGFGLFELRVHPAFPGSDSSIPKFLRPPPSGELVPSTGLERGTSIGNYHGPTIQRDKNSQEFLLIDSVTARKIRRDLERRNLFCVVRS